LNFPGDEDCDFYKWAMRNFLWLTSTADNGGVTFDSREFFSVSPPSDSKRTLTRNEGGQMYSALFALRGPKPVEHDGQPGRHSVLMARNGSLVYYSTQLALVGMHVVGSARRRPEMIWATFEHVDNAPRARYAYRIDTSPNPKWVDPDPAGMWQFSHRNCQPPFNEERIHSRGDPDIHATDPVRGIGESDTCRVNAWGTASDNGDHVDNNTRIIDLNNNTIGKLINGDMRKNYLLGGATWNFSDGTNNLANSVLETYDQEKNCFRCHQGDLANGHLNHMWVPLQPLQLLP
jgi:hypothetical protein